MKTYFPLTAIPRIFIERTLPSEEKPRDAIKDKICPFAKKGTHFLFESNTGKRNR